MPKVIFCLSSSLILSSTILKNEGRLWTFLKSIKLLSPRSMIRLGFRVQLVCPVVIRCLVVRASGVVDIWPLVIRASGTHSLSPPDLLKTFATHFNSGHFLKLFFRMGLSVHRNYIYSQHWQDTILNGILKVYEMSELLTKCSWCKEWFDRQLFLADKNKKNPGKFHVNSEVFKQFLTSVFVISTPQPTSSFLFDHILQRGY